ncbi:MAG TPA: phage major capsid protein [bacterium]|nr:phage major capsid protein [bacterium]HQJ66386.1 phage major capsid protein [bacterium]
MQKETRQFRTLEFRAANVDAAGRIPVVCSTDAVVTVSDGPEVLVHEPAAVDMTRAPFPIIVTHQGNQINIGIVEDIAIGNGEMRGFARFGERPEAVAYARDVMNQIIRSVSVGYQRVKGYIRPDNVLITTRWMPTHVAMVAEPADTGAGFYRAASEVETSFELVACPDQQSATETQSRSSVIDLDAPAAGESQPSKGERSMTQVVDTPAATTTANVQVTGPDPIVAERSRVRDIAAIGRQFNMVELADQHAESGTSSDAFRALVLSKLKDNGQLRVAESPEIGLSENEVQSYSFCRAFLAAQDPLNAAKIAPFEMECSRAAQDKRDTSDARVKEREAAITLPSDVLGRGMVVHQKDAAGVVRSLLQLVSRSSAATQAYFRDLMAGTPTAGGNVVATELLGSSFIDLLRNSMILDRLGVTVLNDLSGNIAIPSQTGAATSYWVAEGGAPTETQQTIGQVPLTPKTIGAFTDFTRRLLLQASIAVELFVRMDLARVLALGLQDGAFNGTGASNQPAGLANIAGIGSVAMGTNGGAPTYDMAVDLETAVSNANADIGNLAYVTNSKVRGKLRKTQVFTGTNGAPVWTSGRERGIGEVLGYDAYVTNTVPSNLTKGSASGICSAAFFGNWSDLVMGLWGGVDLMLDPYANATSGGKRVIALQDVDFNVRNVASFAVVKDILTT